MFNPWRHLRLARSLIIIGTLVSHSHLDLFLLGAGLLSIGTVNGLLALEKRVTKLEEKFNEKIEA